MLGLDGCADGARSRRQVFSVADHVAAALLLLNGLQHGVDGVTWQARVQIRLSLQTPLVQVLSGGGELLIETT